MAFNFLCASPGVAARIIASMAAFCCAALSVLGVSAAMASEAIRKVITSSVASFRMFAPSVVRFWMAGILARTIDAGESDEEDGDDREDQPAGFDAGHAAGKPLRAVEARLEQARGERLAAVVAGVRRAGKDERRVVEQRVEAYRPPDAAGADDGEGHEESDAAAASEATIAAPKPMPSMTMNGHGCHAASTHCILRKISHPNPSPTRVCTATKTMNASTARSRCMQRDTAPTAARLRYAIAEK